MHYQYLSHAFVTNPETPRTPVSRWCPHRRLGEHVVTTWGSALLAGLAWATPVDCGHGQGCQAWGRRAKALGRMRTSTVPLFCFLF
jgi:hypothetical protein